MAGSLFSNDGEIQTQVISRRSDFESLFEGFKKMHAVSYVVSSDLLKEFFEKRGYEEIEIVVGDNMTEPLLRQELQNKSMETIEALADLAAKGALRIMIPKRTIHTKLYILEGAGNFRIIQTSANLTDTARKAIQINYTWYADLPPNHTFIKQVFADYNHHRKNCSLFMEDLAGLIKGNKQDSKKEMIEVWLKGTAMPAPETEAAKVLNELSSQALLSPEPAETSILTVHLPETPDVRKKTENFLKPLSPSLSGNTASLPALTYINRVHVSYGIPLMRIDYGKNCVKLGLKGVIHSVSEPPENKSAVNEALEHIENYIETVDLAKSPDPEFAKASMFEALLYVFFAPFAGEYMRVKRRTYGQADPKGPRFLYIYGPSQNGKTTFFRFALKLITGQDMEALRREEFTRGRIKGASVIGTVFPLPFDDVEFSGKPWVPDIMKSYWETWWTGKTEQPQLMFSSNEPRMKDWARSRVKRIDFDVHFTSSGTEKRRLKEILEYDNRLFRWFSYIYLERISGENHFSDDELYISRSVMLKLYEYAGRKKPRFFLEQPIEKCYDLGKKRWADLVYRRHEAKLVKEQERILVRFPDNMQFWEIRRFEGYLPPTVKARQEGHTIIIETPAEFDIWCPPARKKLRLWR